MWAYILRRILWTVPILFGIVLITFVLFTFVAPDPARLRVGKDATPEKLRAERKKMGLDKPIWFNFPALRTGSKQDFFDTQFFDVVTLRLPDSDHYKKPVWELIGAKGPVSLAVQGPVFFISIGLQLILSLLCAQWRNRWPDRVITLVAVLGMCIPYLSIIVLLQWLLGFKLGLFPVAGWSPWPQMLYFVTLPVIVGVVADLGNGTRFYRTVMLEEVYNDYVRTARAKGVRQSQVLLTHVLRNALIPVITNTVTHLPYLILGSLLLERLFQIPGLGYIMVEAIFNQDRPVVLGLTFFFSVTYCLLLLVTDILYTLVDPRVKLES